MERDPYSELTREVLESQRQPGRNKGLVEKISRIVYAYPRNYLGWDEDDVGDFFCMFFPKIEGLIRRFAFTGKPFEAYLSASIRWQMKSFMRRRAADHAGREVVRSECRRSYGREAAEGRDGWTSELVHVYSPAVAKVFGIGPDGRISDKSISRRFVFLVLRNVLLADDSLIEHAAKLSGMDADHLLGCATELRQIIMGRKARHMAMAERRDRLYARIQHLTLLLSSETDPVRIETYKRQIAFARNRYEKNVKILKSAVLQPTHKEIGEVLGVPKGSIDSGLYYMRRDMTNLERN